MYTIESLKAIQNGSLETTISAVTVEKINKIISVIEAQKNNVPNSGDIIKITARTGAKYDAHVCEINEDGIYLCTRAFIPYATENGCSASVSGGYFKYINPKCVKFEGTAKKEFWNFANGSGANKGVHFNARVNVWRFTGDSDLFY